MDAPDVARSVMRDGGITLERMAKLIELPDFRHIQGRLKPGMSARNLAQMLDALGYDLMAVPRRGTKAADGTKARPYTIDPPERRSPGSPSSDKLAPPNVQGKIE